MGPSSLSGAGLVAGARVHVGAGIETYRPQREGIEVFGDRGLARCAKACHDLAQMVEDAGLTWQADGVTCIPPKEGLLGVLGRVVLQSADG